MDLDNLLQRCMISMRYDVILVLIHLCYTTTLSQYFIHRPFTCGMIVLFLYILVILLLSFYSIVLIPYILQLHAVRASCSYSYTSVSYYSVILLTDIILLNLPFPFLPLVPLSFLPHLSIPPPLLHASGCSIEFGNASIGSHVRNHSYGHGTNTSSPPYSLLSNVHLNDPIRILLFHPSLTHLSST